MFDCEKELEKLNRMAAERSRLVMELNSMRVQLLKIGGVRRLLLLRLIDRFIREVHADLAWHREFFEIRREQEECLSRGEEKRPSYWFYKMDGLMKREPELKWLLAAEVAAIGFKLGREHSA